MRILRKKVSVLTRLGMVPAGILAWIAMATLAAAQPVNDNFADAEVISGIWGTVNVETGEATGEPGEPSHAGFPPQYTVWYKFTAPHTGEITLNTFGSDFNTLMAVYSGTNLQTLAQIAANYGANFGANWNSDGYFAPVAGAGPSGLRFNTVQNETYYIAVGGGGGGGLYEEVFGNLTFSWAYYPAGNFRFATGSYRQDMSGKIWPYYECSEWELFAPVDILANFHDQPGVVITVTRNFGSSGRMLVDYEAVDLTAINGLDYFLEPGTLIFNEYEMSRTIVVPILPSDPMYLPGDTEDAYVRYFTLQLTGVRADDQESPDVALPTIDPMISECIVAILDMDIDPIMEFNQDTNGDFTGPTNPVFNIEKRVFRTAEGLDQISLFVFRFGTNRAAASVNYNTIGAPFYANNRLDNGFELQAGSDYATPTLPNGGISGDNPDFTPATGTLNWGENDFDPKEITFTINQDEIPEFNEDFFVTIWRTFPGYGRIPAGMVSQATVTILTDPGDAPAGAVDTAWNPDLSLISVPPGLLHPGPDGVVYDLRVHSDDKVIVVGDFRSYNGSMRNRIARINADGTLDTTFNPGDGANSFITKVVQTGPNYLIAGGFSFFNGTQRNGIARLLSSGALDPSFAPGLGANGVIWALALQPDGKVLIGGEFTTYNGTNSPHIARLNPNGSLDTTFSPGQFAPNGVVNCIAVTPSGKIVIGGEFTALGTIPLNNLARYNTDGTPDTEFNNNLGFAVNGPVYDIAVQGSQAVLGGEFTQVGIFQRTRIARLNDDGTVDTSYFTGIGADDTIYTIRPQPDGTTYVSGLFSSFNGTRRVGLARLRIDGTVDTSFLDTAYNHYAGLARQYFDKTVTPMGVIWAMGVTASNQVIIGGAFEQIGGGPRSGRIQPPEDSYLGNYEALSRAGIRNRRNLGRLHGGQTPGPGNIGMLYDSYTINQGQTFALISLTRTNGFLGFSSAHFQVQPSVAQSSIDYFYNDVAPIYLSTWPGARQINEGLSGTNILAADRFGNGGSTAIVLVSLLNSRVPGNKSAVFRMANPGSADTFYLGGENIPLGHGLAADAGSFSILDDNHYPGTVGFESASASVSEGSNIVVKVTRSGGSYGTVSVRYTTVDGTARQNVDYTYNTGTLTFKPGEVTKTFTVATVNNALVQPQERTLTLRLSNPTGAPYPPVLGIASQVLSIVDDDYPPGYVNFTAATFTTNETASALRFTVRRTGGNKGTITVKASTINGTAFSGTHYIATTNILQWDNGDSADKILTVPLLHDGIVGVDKTFTNILTEATVNTTNAPTVLGGLLTRSTGLIREEDSLGQVRFASPTYIVNEHGGYATVTVIRVGGSAESITVNYATQEGTAVSSGVLPNFQAVSGTLTFAPGEVAKSISIPIVPDGLPDADPFFFSVALSSPVPAGVIASPEVAVVYIVDREAYNVPAGSLDGSFDPQPGFDGDVYRLVLQPNGQIIAAGDFLAVNNTTRTRLARLNVDGSLDNSFQHNVPGANAAVRALLMQSDNRLVVGGSFTKYNGINRNRFARILGDGSIDSSFNIGAGADGDIFALAETFSGTNRFILVGGAFNTFNGQLRPGLARLNNEGDLDPKFNPGLVVDGTVYAIAVYPTNTIHPGKILIAGEFTSVSGVSVPGLARLTSNGELDLSFDPGAGASAPVRALTIQRDGKVLIGGSFTNFNGISLSRLARLNPNGTVDATFNLGVGANDTVEAIVIQPDNRIIVAGQFTRFSGVTRRGITRLLPDGSVDPAINFGSGTDAFVNSVVVQADGHIVLAGGFSSYDGTTRRKIARIYGGSLSGSGRFEFTAPAFTVDENATNAVVSIRRQGGTALPISIQCLSQGGTAIPGVNYSNATQTITFPVGETFLNVLIPVIQDLQITPDLTVQLSLANPGPPAELGDQPVALLTIRNIDSTVSFSAAAYVRNENAIDEAATITVLRRGSTRLTSTVDFLTTTNGTAVAYTNYIPVTNTLTFLPGDNSRTLKVPLVYSASANGDVTVEMEITNAVNTLLAAPVKSTLTIVDIDKAPGQFLFAATNYMVAESAGFLPVTIVRTNGRSGTVSVNFQTVPGTALPGVKYVATNGTLTFADGELSKVIQIPIIQESQVTGDLTFSIGLLNPVGGTILPPATVPVTIHDDDIGVGFASSAYITTEEAGSVALTVLRQNGTNEVTTVNFATTNRTALAGTNYAAAAGVLTFNKGETIKSFSINILDSPLVTGDLTFEVNLSNPSAPAQLMTATTLVTILDMDPGISFTNATFGVLKSGTNAIITVTRTNANTGLVTVNYATTNGTALAGVDYVPASGTLTFSNGVAFQSFTVPIISNRLAQGNREFTIGLFNPTPTNLAQLVIPHVASVVITDDIAGLSFSAPAYSAPENSGRKTIEVRRSNFLDSTVSVNYATADGTARALTNYIPTSGTLTFTNGEAVKTFDVQIISDSLIQGGPNRAPEPLQSPGQRRPGFSQRGHSHHRGNRWEPGVALWIRFDFRIRPG
jgi:uncharacterized delta-60 repeat protein